MGSYRTPRLAAPPPAVVSSANRQSDSKLFQILTNWRHAPRLAQVLDPKHNSFSILRLAMALAVLVSHAVFLVTGTFSAEPLVAQTGYSLGQYGVQGFFILSGILVTQSLVNRGDLFDFARARTLRIFPALIVCVALTAFVAGPALSALGLKSYFTSSGLIQYIAKTLSLSTGSATLPGVFASNPAPGVVNQSLWTLKYEVACYLLLGLIAAVIWRSPSRRVATLVAGGAWLGLIVFARPSLAHNGTFFATLTYFALFFGTGVSAFLLRDRLLLAWQPLVPLGLAFVLAWETRFAEIASALFVGYALLWISSLPFGRLRAYTNTNDYSYGTYIYSYPVSQALLAAWPTLNVFSLVCVTMGITFLLAFLSWELVERPALGLVKAWRGRKSSKCDADASTSSTVSHVIQLVIKPRPARAVSAVAKASPAASRPARNLFDRSSPPIGNLKFQARLARISRENRIQPDR